MKLNVNGKITPCPEGYTLAQLLSDLALRADRPGLAIAVNDEVTGRAEWNDLTLKDGDRIEIIQAVQGG